MTNACHSGFHEFNYNSHIYFVFIFQTCLLRKEIKNDSQGTSSYLSYLLQKYKEKIFQSEDLNGRNHLGGAR
jgi:hypothetical protein